MNYSKTFIDRPIATALVMAGLLLAGALASALSEDAVVVAPDLGAVKLAERYAAVLGRPVAVVRKTRVSGSTVRAEELVGDVDGRLAVIVDDMISTGSTIEAAVEVLLANRAAPEIVVVATHGLLVGPARDRLAALPIRRLVVTDSVAMVKTPLVALEVRSVAPMIADAIGRLHRNEPLGDLLVSG